jgi:hypothetical protein
MTNPFFVILVSIFFVSSEIVEPDDIFYFQENSQALFFGRGYYYHDCKDTLDAINGAIFSAKKWHSEDTIIIQGYIDSHEREKDILSRLRVDKIKKYFLDENISESRIKCYYYSDNKLIFGMDRITAICEGGKKCSDSLIQYNRRVEIYFKKK